MSSGPSERIRQIMNQANTHAQRLNHEYVGTEHLLLALIEPEFDLCVGTMALKNVGCDLGSIRRNVEAMVKPGLEMVTMGRLPQTRRAKKVIEFAIEEVRNCNHTQFDSGHLLLGLMRELEGVASKVLRGLGLRLDEMREEVIEIMGKSKSGPKPSEESQEEVLLGVVERAVELWSDDQPEPGVIAIITKEFPFLSNTQLKLLSGAVHNLHLLRATCSNPKKNES